MRVIRVVAVGLLLTAAVVMTEGTHALSSQAVISVSSASLGGIVGVLCASLGLGLLISALAYAPIDAYLSGVVEAVLRRNEQTDFARMLRRRYTPWLAD